MIETKVSRDVAEAEFERWAATYEVDTDVSDLGKEDKDAFNAFKMRFVKRVTTGAVTIDDEGVVVFTPRSLKGDVMKFAEPTGALLSARQPNDSDAQGLRRILAQWTGAPATRFAEMSLADFNFCAALLTFFSAS